MRSPPPDGRTLRAGARALTRHHRSHSGQRSLVNGVFTDPTAGREHTGTTLNVNFWVMG